MAGRRKGLAAARFSPSSTTRTLRPKKHDVRFTPKSDIDRDTPFCLAALGSPKVFETRWRQFRISHRMMNIFVAEVRLQCPCVVTPVRQCVAAGMSKHMRMHTELELGLLAQSGHHLGEARPCERRAPLRHEHERRVR